MDDIKILKMEILSIQRRKMNLRYANTVILCVKMEK